jgi:hypothetical protein
MKKITKRKLVLSKKTVQQLKQNQAGGMQGGPTKNCTRANTCQTCVTICGPLC